MIYAVYILIAVGLAWYLSRTKGDGSEIGPGSIFFVQWWARILATFVPLVLGSGVIYFAADAVRPSVSFAGGVMVFGCGCFAYVLLLTAKIEITHEGLKMVYLGRSWSYRFNEFSAVSTYRYNIVLERKDGGRNITFPAIFTNTAGLYHYLRIKIEKQ